MRDFLGFKILDAERQGSPLALVVGDREEVSGGVTPRRRQAQRGNLQRKT